MATIIIKSDGTAYLLEGAKLSVLHGGVPHSGVQKVRVDATSWENLVAAYGAAVTGAPGAEFTSAQGAGHTMAFTDTSTNTPTAWSWTFGDGATAITKNPSRTFAAAGSYTVTLIATNAKGSSVATSHVVVVA